MQLAQKFGRWLEIGADTSPRRQMIVNTFVIILLGLLCLPFFNNPIERNPPPIRNGIISFAGKGPLDDPVSLEGDWGFTWHSALGKTPEGALPPFTMKVPGVWNGTRAPNGEILPHRGVATYQLVLRDLRPGQYRIAIPTIFVASEVLIDGRLASKRGMIGFSPETTRYLWRGQDVGFEADGRDVILEIRMAAQLHRDNGFDTAPAIGLAEPIQDWSAQRLAQEFLSQITLMLLAVFCLVVFFYRSRDPTFVYFSIAAFALMPASMILGFDNLLTMAFPGLPFPIMLAIVYLGACLSIGMALLYVHTLFRAESPVLGYRIMMGVVLAFTLVQAGAFLVGGTYLASLVNVRLVTVMLIVFSHLIFVIMRAVIKGRDGAMPFLIGMGVFLFIMLLVGSIASGITARDKIGPVANASFGMVILLFSQIVVLAERWSRSISFSEATADDLRRLLEVNSSITSEMELEALLSRIVEVNSRILRAERSSLFLFDEKADELWALVAEGVERRMIRFPSSKGIAGQTFQSGIPTIVANAYANPEFNRTIDEQTGFRTRNIVTVPIITREGRRLGVLQALNRHNGGAFDENDLSRMRAFAAQAAIALDNATLFSEVISSRNYNESILRSMSSGVVTIDTDSRVAKFNAAACEILCVSEDRLQGMDARTALSQSNPALVAETDAVSESGVPKTLLDYELVTGTGDLVSVNITIVPLTSETEDMGLLVLIEDISEGKRLQGAMRRFMPQEVVEQVLGHDDELMFGTACQASILFADIRNFTSMAEALTPRETVDMLNEIFTELFEAVAAANGTIDKYMGDAIMAVYGAPIPGERDAANAAESAVHMVTLIEGLNERRVARGLEPLRIGVGIASGEVVAGTIGSPKRMDYTVVGDSVNLAARLQEATKIYGADIILCEDSALRLAGAVPLRELDLIRTRGRKKPVKIFEAVMPHPDVPKSKRAEALLRYAEGRAALSRREWEKAAKAFSDAIKLDPSDQPARLMQARARHAMASPPPADWDGVW